MPSDKAIAKALRTAAWIVRRRYKNDDEYHSVAQLAVATACVYFCGLGSFEKYSERCVRLALWHFYRRETRRRFVEIEYCRGRGEIYAEYIVPEWSVDFDTLPRDELKLIATLRYGTTQSYQQLSELTSLPVWHIRLLLREVVSFFRNQYKESTSGQGGQASAAARAQ